MENYATVREMYESCQESLSPLNGKEVCVDGWVRSNRLFGNIGFLSFNDGTCFKNAQLVYGIETEGYEEIKKIRLGTAISVSGTFRATPEAKQPFEISLSSATVVGDVDESYPLQKKKTSLEYLRTIPHLRPRTNTFNAVFRVRSVLSFAIHEFFQGEGFVYVHTPLLTSNDCEGAGETFKAASELDKPLDFFGRPVNLTVSGQLHVEPFALAFRDVYTFGPTFRAEKSNTRNHSAEFWMIEPEIAFADLDDDMDLIEDFLKYIVRYVRVNCPDEMSFFDERIAPGLLQRLDSFTEQPFKRLTYTEAIEILQKAVAEGHKFENSNIYWGIDLQTEHERYLTEQVAGGPMFLTDYPKEIKSFYMKQNSDGKTVAAVDLLVPGIGELVGGSEREVRYEVLQKRIEELKMNQEYYQWYLDLRRYGGCPHAGFGLGFERMLMFITGIENIRDVEAYPRSYKEILF